MSTDFFRRYLDLLNEATGQPPADFTPTHFHKNNLGFKIPLMQTPDGSFWWETTATSDDGGAVQRGSARKSIQPWIGDTENRSSGFSGKSSVDGVFKDGKAIEFPEGMTWKEYAASAEKSPQAALPAAKSKQIEPELLAPLEPTASGRKLVDPNKNVAPEDPPGYRFSNDQALANLAAQMKDAESGNKSSSFNRFNKTGDADGTFDFRKGLRTASDAEDSSTAVASSDSAAASGSAASVAAGSLPAGVQWAFAQNDKFRPSSEADSIASWKANNPGKSSADWGPAAIPAAGKGDEVWDPRQRKMVPKSELSTAKGKETMITDSSRCAQCGTPKSIHAPLKHQFVPGDDVRPGPVGGSAPSSDRSVKPSTDTLAADQARIDKMTPYDRSTGRPVGAKPTAPPAPPRSLNAPKKPSFVKEDINRLPVVDQMSAWRQLIEADPKVPALLRPGVTTNRVPTNPPAAGPSRFDSPEAIKAAVDRMTNARTPAPETPGFLRSAVDNIRARASARATPAPAPPPNLPPPASVPPESALGKLGKTTARGFDMVYQIYEGYKQIIKLDYDTMPRDQYAAAVSKIVARLAGDYGLFWVGSLLGAFTAGLFTANPLGAIGGFVAGGTGGLAASYLLGDSVGAITDSIVDSVYGTDSTPKAEQPKLNPQQIGELKQYIAEMEAWAAAGNKLDQGQQQDLDKAKALAKAVGVTVAPAPEAAERVPAAADPVARYKETFDKANAIVDKIKNLDPMTNPALSSSASGAALAKVIYNLIGEITSLYASEIGAEGQKDPAVAKQMESILAAARAAAEAKSAEHDAGRGKTTTGGPKEGDKGTSKNGRPIIFTNGRWEYAN